MNQQLLTDPRAYVRFWASRNNPTDQNGVLYVEIKRAGLSIKPTNLLLAADTLLLDYSEDLRVFNASSANRVRVALKDVELKRAVVEFCDEHYYQAVQEISKGLVCSTEDLSHLEQFTLALTNQSKKEDVYALAHFVWSIKRKLYGFSVVDHIMPVLYGPQKTGKSTAVRALLSPLKFLSKESDLSSVTDNRTWKELENIFCYNLDECQYAEKSDINALKSLVTSPRISFRPMGTNRVVEIQNNSAFIGSSNRPLMELFYDPTGMRRFYQVDVLSPTNRELLNKIDFLALWKGIDEARTNGYVHEVIDAVEAQQEANTAIDPIEAFCTQINLLAGTDLIPVINVYRRYSSWAEERGYKPLNIESFSKKVCSTCHIQRTRPRFKDETAGSDKRTTCFLINKAAYDAPGLQLIDGARSWR